MVDGSEEFFTALITNNVFSGGAHIQCMGSGISDTCTTSEAAIHVVNTAEGLDGEMTEAFTTLAGLKLANCEVAGNETGIDEGLGILTIPGSGTLTASE